MDPRRPGTAAKDTPFGTTIQHGFLTLGMSTGLLWSVCVVEGFGVILNYGLNKVRFPAMLSTGSRYRMHVEIAEVKQLKGGVEVVWRLTYEVEGKPKPCCVADLVFRYYPLTQPPAGAGTPDRTTNPTTHLRRREERAA